MSDLPVRKKTTLRDTLDQKSETEIASILLDLDPQKALAVATEIFSRSGKGLGLAADVVAARMRQAPGRTISDLFLGAIERAGTGRSTRRS